MENEVATITRRDLGKPSQKTICLDELYNTASDIMTQIQSDMLAAVLKRNEGMITQVASLDELEKALEVNKIGFFRIKYEQTNNEKFDVLIDKYKISRRCLDDADPTFVFVAKSY
jgi:hypothetical protein